MPRLLSRRLDGARQVKDRQPDRADSCFYCPRCLYLSQTYALVGKYPESLSLAQRANLYVRQLRSSPLTPEELATVGTSEMTDVAEDESSHVGVTAFAVVENSVTELEKELAMAEDRSKKDWYVFQLAEQEEAKGDGQDAAAEAINRLSLRPAVKKATKKRAGPLFFDVAFNYVAGIDLDVLDSASKGRYPDVAESANPARSTVQQTKDVVTEAATPAKEIVEEAINASAGNTPSKASAGRGIWGFFGRGKK